MVDRLEPQGKLDQAAPGNVASIRSSTSGAGVVLPRKSDFNHFPVQTQSQQFVKWFFRRHAASVSNSYSHSTENSGEPNDFFMSLVVAARSLHLAVWRNADLEQFLVSLLLLLNVRRLTTMTLGGESSAWLPPAAIRRRWM